MSVQSASHVQAVVMRGKQVQDGATDIVTCGGLQSAHTAAFAAAAAEAGMRAHLLVPAFHSCPQCSPHPCSPRHARLVFTIMHFVPKTIYNDLLLEAAPGRLLP